VEQIGDKLTEIDSKTDNLIPHSVTPPDLGEALFSVDMQWGQQPVRLTAFRCREMPAEAPVTSVHVVSFCGERVLVVRDRKGSFGYPGGRLEAGETIHDAMCREVFEEACAHLHPGYELFAVLRIECTAHIPGREYPHPYSYMGMYAGLVKALEPVARDPAGIITGRDLFTLSDCERRLDEHDRILLREAIAVMKANPATARRIHTFLNGSSPVSRS
jgi:ADP-ribose pyrophosphatase YjhB (NUDIX family)